MRRHDEGIDPQRRSLLLKALGGFVLGASPCARALAAELLGARSIYLLKGEVRINGVAARPESTITGGDLIETGAASEIIFRVESDAFILRANSRLQLSPPPGDPLIVQGLRLLTGGLLSVFAHRPHRVTTYTATIGIRGTGVYCEVEPDRDYLCTCYGVTDIAATDDPQSAATVDAGHHEPRYVLREAPRGERIRKASFKQHTDEELLLIESLVGRTPAFRGAGESYARPRRRSY